MRTTSKRKQSNNEDVGDEDKDVVEEIEGFKVAIVELSDNRFLNFEDDNIGDEEHDAEEEIKGDYAVSVLR